MAGQQICRTHRRSRRGNATFRKTGRPQQYRIPRGRPTPQRATLHRSARAIAHACGKHRETAAIEAVHQPASEAPTSREIRQRNRPATTTPIARRGHARGRRLPAPSMAKHRGLLHRPTASIGQTIRTTTTGLTSRHRRNATHRPMTTVAIRNRARTIRRPRAPTPRRRHELIPLRAAAIRLLRAPTPRLATPHRATAIRLHHTPTPRLATPHRATAIAVAEAARVEAVEAEARTVGAEARLTVVEVVPTDTTNS
jgi:hypothetical protein